ncbi:MAG: RdgB/HAM1 family non-canonical purine NTP pyrophosphatase [Gemmatimonadales bacterium]
MKLLVATRNAGKQREARRLLGVTGMEPVFPDEAGLLETQAESVLEIGDTFAANARAKAEHFARRSGLPTVADDSGLEVFALGGAPGVRSKRFAGASGEGLTGTGLDQANNAELLRRLMGAPPARRRARFRCVLAYYPSPDAIPELVEGVTGGTIVEEARGGNGFGYDPLFFSDELGKTFAEATGEEKDAVSHRGRAFRALVELLGAATRGNPIPERP